MLRRIVLQNVTADELHETTARVAAEYPDVLVTRGSGAQAVVGAAEWQSDDLDFFAFDRRVDRAMQCGHIVAIDCGGSTSVERFVGEVLTRTQRWIARRNDASATEAFSSVLTRHRMLHDLSKPLVQADYDHSVDVWQWLLRVAPAASLELQVAALFHDVERLTSESDVRVEQHARDYQSFKNAHARGGAEIAAAQLEGVGLAQPTIDEICRLVRSHEEPGEDESLALVNDADALSFFSLNSAGFLNYYGIEHTRMKVAYTLRRLRRQQYWRLGTMRLLRPVREMLGGRIE